MGKKQQNNDYRKKQKQPLFERSSNGHSGAVVVMSH